jgi:hypothetical protein
MKKMIISGKNNFIEILIVKHLTLKGGAEQLIGFINRYYLKT